MELSEKMLRFRAKHDMTQRQFAQLCGLSRRTIVNAENGEVSKFARAKIEYHMEETEKRCRQQRSAE